MKSKLVNSSEDFRHRTHCYIYINLPEVAIVTKLAVAWCYSGRSGMLEGVVVVRLIKKPLLKGWLLSWLPL